MTKAATFVERPLSALDTIFARRSVRAYTSDPVEKSTIRALLDAAVQAPTAMLEQPWLFVVIQDRPLLNRLSDHIKATWMREAIETADRHTRYASTLHGEYLQRVQEPGLDVLHGAGTVISICARRVDPLVVADCWLAAENLLLAATALGLGTCCIGPATDALNSAEMKAAVGIPADVHVVASVVVGVPAETPRPVPRREPDVIAWK